MRFKFFILFVLLSAPLHAQEMPAPEGVKVGVLKGRVFAKMPDGKEQPLANQEIAMVVFQDHQQVLMLNKNSDAEGNFEFKNMFRDPSYEYVLGTLYNEQTFVFGKFSVSEEVKKFDFWVGEGSPYLLQEKIPMPSGGGGEEASAPRDMPPAANQIPVEKTAGALGKDSHQRIALALAIGIVLMMVYLMASRAGKNSAEKLLCLKEILRLRDLKAAGQIDLAEFQHKEAVLFDVLKGYYKD